MRKHYLLINTENVLETLVVKFVQKFSLPLIKGSPHYEIWSKPTSINFSCYLFNVTNPDEVMRGENPHLVEYGPFTYTEVQEKFISYIDKEMDEIKYTTKSTYTFDRYQSLNFSKQDKIIILNPAYIGTIETLAALPDDFMKKYGNSIPKLFPNRSSIFLKARPTDVLFDGVKITCNPKKFPELQLICETLKLKQPPVLREGEKENVYYLSFFQRLNNTSRGPFTVSRGVKDITKLGDITSYLGYRVQEVFATDLCNTVRGSDTITWAPLMKPLPKVSTFIQDICRTVEIDYENEVVLNGMIGSQFVMHERVWYLNESECYCPLVDKQPVCPRRGLIDAYQCQKVPVFVSEPHFLHGDPELLNYARGLTPNEVLHKTYVVIEPYTGIPLAGEKKTQLNLKLARRPVNLLANISEGYFPLLWFENGNKLTPFDQVLYPYQLLRYLHFMRYLQYIPLIIGIYLISISLLFYGDTSRRVHPNATNVQSILISNSRLNRPPQRQVVW
ncbi:sensory neuron membrane protein 2 isoform X2 [Megachile rotundata]|uniref:sensory neuron membrane protein 2 isoform X2 n=1 Tax=Megachile rotundata TaxID=143995 RepID=UPI003FD47B11